MELSFKDTDEIYSILIEYRNADSAKARTLVQAKLEAWIDSWGNDKTDMFNQLFTAIGTFSVKAFPTAKSIEHLKKLKHEADEAIEQPSDISEYADCIVALFAAAYKAGISANDLLHASNDKLEKIRNLKWTILPDGTYQSVK